MTIKQKFSSIDQSKLTADQKAFLTKIKDVTKNFTDSEMNKKVEAPLDGFIEKAKEKMPEAIKSAPVKTASKAKAQRKKPARTVMSVAKEIRKEGESWKEAQVRAKQMMKTDSAELSKTVETELDKLSKLVKSAKTRSKLSGISGTDIKRDSVRKAKPRGARRVTHSGETSNQYGTFSNKLGRKYYESRDRHSDRLAPRYPKNAPLLENGAYLTDPNFGNFQSQVYAKGGGVRQVGNREYSYGRNWTNDHEHVNKSEEHEVKYNRKGKFLGMFNDGGGVDKPLKTYEIFKNGTQQGEVQATSLKEAKRKVFATYGERRDVYEAEDEEYNKGGALRNERKHVNHNEDYEVRYAKPRPSRTGYKGKRSFELGGTVVTDLAGHTGGGTGGLDAGMPLSGFSNTSYSGLVGETGAMSSGEMFENGGGIQQSYVVVDSFGNPAQHLNKGGALRNERKHVNHNEDYEVRYAKPRQKRTGYKGARKFMAGGMNDNSPKIYVADLEAYNSGRLVGEWLDLSDYNDADELMDAINGVLKKSGGEEYAIHDYENLPSGMYSEYMGARDFAELYEMMDLAKENDLPLAVVQEIVSQFDESAVDEYMGRYDSVVDFSEQLVDDLGGLENFSSPEYYVYITNTDRRLIAGEEADNAVENARDNDEFDDMSEDEQQEAEEKLRDEVYDQWYDGLDDPYTFLVEEQGLYGAEDFFNASFISVDYEKLASDLEQDYTFVQHDGEVYVFNIR